MRAPIVVLVIATSARGAQLHLPAHFELSWHTHTTSFMGEVSYNFSGANRWPDPSKTDLQVTVGQTSCGSILSAHYFLGIGEKFGLSWNPCFTASTPDCQPFFEVPSAETAAFMSFPGINDTVQGTWLAAPKVVGPPYNYSAAQVTGRPCRLYSKLQQSCAGKACWRLPGQPQNFFYGATQCSGIGGAKEFDWCAVTDLCFASNATSAGTLPPWDSLVGISFSDRFVSEFNITDTLINVTGVVAGDVELQLPRVCENPPI